MVQAIISISDHANMVLNVVKAKYGLRDKSEAINMMAEQYEENVLEPQLRPEYVEKIKEIERKGVFHNYSSLKELRQRIERT